MGRIAALDPEMALNHSRKLGLDLAETGNHGGFLTQVAARYQNQYPFFRILFSLCVSGDTFC